MSSTSSGIGVECTRLLVGKYGIEKYTVAFVGVIIVYHIGGGTDGISMDG